MAVTVVPSLGLALRALGLVCAGYLIKGVVMLYQKRTWFRKLTKQHNLKILPNHSFIFGDLISLGKGMAKYPEDVAGHIKFELLIREYPELAEAGAFYIDLWPISWPMLVVCHPDMCAQFTQETSLPKHEILHYEFQEFSQCKDLVTTDGSYWKKWRSIYNPGFAAQNVQMLVPSFVEEALVLKKYFKDIAGSGEKIRLEDQVMKATCDIIGRAVLGKSLGIQTTDAPLFKALKKNVSWLVATWSPLYWSRALHPMRRFSLWWNNRIMFNELKPMIEDQLRNDDRIGGPKTINGLAIRAYKKDYGSDSTPSGTIDHDFLETTVEQMKIFLFAGHDTTSSTLCYAYYRLHKHPEVLAKLRAEHDAVFGPDPSFAADKITATPTLLNQLPYTTAVLKETLRLSPPIASVRQGQPDFYLVHPETRQRLPTEGMCVMSASQLVQHHKDFWPEPLRFLPERWLAREGDPLRPKKNAWRPFELGPRGCLGQELVMMEMRMILALTVRDLEIVPAYDKGAETYNGDEAYQSDVYGELVPHPKDGMPVTIRMREHVPSA